MATDDGAGGLRAIATFEASKGALALLAGFGLLLLWDADAQAVGERLARHLHLNPGRLHGGVIGKALQDAGAHLRWIALGSVAYAGVRFTEAYGLWRERTWAEWFGVVSGLIYVPLDVLEIARRPGVPSFAMLALNLLIVGFLARRLRPFRRSRTQAGS
jgi:uncharacterized membrane protein (DUF2068 family)